MKAFLDGSTNILEVPEEVKVRLAELAKDKSEFVLFDKRGASSGMKEFLKKEHFGKLTIIDYEPDVASYDAFRTAFFAEDGCLRTHHSSDANYYHQPLEADVLMFIWDGCEPLVFLEILNEVIFENKSVEVWTPFSSGLKVIESIEDIYEVLPASKDDRMAWNDAISTNEYDRIVRAFLPSKEMAKHLVSLPQNKRMLASLILGSPYPLEQKLLEIDRLAQKQDYLRDVVDELMSRDRGGKELCFISTVSFKYMADEISRALDALNLKPGETMILGERWSSDDSNIFGRNMGYAGFAPFQTIEAVQAYVKDDIEDDEDEDILYWYELEKWVPWNGGIMELEYSFTMIKDQLVSFTHYQPNFRDQAPNEWKRVSDRYSSSMRLSLPVPYKPGDIVKIDCLPFASPRYVCLFDFWGLGDGEIATLYRDEDGLWKEGSFNSNSSIDYVDGLSLFYRLQKVESFDEVPCDGGFLFKVQEFVDGSNFNGEILWEEFQESMKGGYSDEEIRERLNEAKHKLASGYIPQKFKTDISE